MAAHLTLLALLEAIWILLSFLCAIYLRNQGDIQASEGIASALSPETVTLGGFLMLSMVSVGLYRARHSAAFTDTLARLLPAAVLGASLYSVAQYFLPFFSANPGTLGLGYLFALAAIALNRRACHLLFGTPTFNRNVLILGNGEAAAQLARSCMNRPDRTFRLAGFMANSGAIPCTDCLPRLERDEALVDYARHHHIDEIVVALDDRRQSFPARDLLHCRLAGVRVTEALTFIERETRAIDLDVLRPGWLIYGRGFHRNSTYRALKEAADVLASFALLLLTSPVLFAAMLAILAESRGRGGVFYQQWRVGYRGRPFKLLKLRTMIPEAEADGQARWAADHDSRITRVGALLRRFRIDELPQAINILKGEMSFVGPRPERPEFVANLNAAIPYYDERHWVKPGLTGWAQICYPYGASTEDAKQKLQYDLYYVKHQNPIFDLFIILQTIEVIIWGSQSTLALREVQPARRSRGTA